MNPVLRIGVLGAARIAASFCQGVAPSTALHVTAVASRSADRAAAFAQANGVPRVRPDYDALLGDAEIDAVYIALSNDQHVLWALRALAAGKHVLCEKPMALSVDDVDRLRAAADAAGRVVMEAFPYRFQPQTLDLLTRVRGGQIGRLRQLSGMFGFTLRRDADIRLDPALGGGSLWDVGVYPLSLIRALAGGLPATVQASAAWGGTGVDRALAAVLVWDDGLMATLQCWFDAVPHRHLRIVGTESTLASGFFNHVGPGQDWVEVAEGYDSRREPVPQGNGFLLEAEAFAALARGEEPRPHWPTWAETRDTTRLAQALLRSATEGRPIAP
ncbi:Gfo/Idh/MocA family oxidoreductase [Silanimonas sp.]|jgi:predicted dehydrogenase|uniref:Gfo/Idh/MocA family protein n=1 Tax=Silanimonas sp. TaxID=1929290 RepID=UPI0022C12C40|nr:Gfo/Idh/MocA family oxidoreductase [Silanimonas sp.]MCZ8063852.1 Gfo/Idh/MocA family oxidoreductase [Silanimonas sp.]